MPLVAVFPRKEVRGVYRPNTTDTYDWRAMFGSPANTRCVSAQGKVMTIDAACAQQWSTEAHFVQYVLHREDGSAVDAQPRVNKAGLDWVESLGFRALATVLVTDIDNPGHAPWNDEWLDVALEQIQKLDAFKIGGWYFTAHGMRLAHQLAAPVDVREFEPIILTWLAELEAQGLKPDYGCTDWTRFFKLPWIRRADGIRQQQLADFDTMRARPVPVATGEAVKRTRARRPVVANVDFIATLPGEWQARALAIGEAVRATPVDSNWHDLFLALAGAMCQRKIALGIVPALIAAVSHATGSDTRADDRVTGARSTIQKFMMGEAIVGSEALMLGWPDVAITLDRVVFQASANINAEALPPAAKASEEIEQAIATAPDGVSVIAAGCGVGKTRATVAVAVKAAARGRSPKGRAKAGSKTAISEPTNAMAKQVVESVRAAGGRVLRVFSPASEVDENGAPVCRFVDSAKALAGARMSVPWELCDGREKDPCPHRDTCSAAAGKSGDEDALVVVGNHGLIASLIGHAGVSGMRVIDEPPPLLETHSIQPLDVAAFWQHAHCFEQSYLDALKDAVQAFASLLQTMPLDVGAQEIDQVITTDAIARANAVDAHQGPRMRWTHVRRAREHSAFAKDLGRAARASWLIWRALTSTARWVVRREDRGGVSTLLFTGPNEELVHALVAEGRTVILDASPDLAVLSKTAGYDLAKRTSVVHAADGATIQRAHLYWSNGSRRALMEGGTLRLDRFASGLRAAFAWAGEDPATKVLGVITLAPFRAALDAARSPDDEVLLREWRRRGYRMDLRNQAIELLGPHVRGWAGEIVFGHYGAIRGLDSFKHVDALVTIGDPWPNLGDVRNDVAYLGEDSEVADKRSEWLARVELEQAHGRLRAPHRTRPGRAIHIGRLLPFGPGWDGSIEVRRMPVGRPENESAASADDLRVWIDRNAKGSVRAAAAVLGCTHTTLGRYLKGSIAIPPSVATRIQSGTETPDRDSLEGVSVPLVNETRAEVSETVEWRA
jgi:hypothetical protein